MTGLNPKPAWSCLPFSSRKGWTRTHFSDVVEDFNKMKHNPVENGIESFVGLEHIDRESPGIKRWGLIADGTSFTTSSSPAG